MAIASALGQQLPPTPDSRALAVFLKARKEADPADFPELSHAIIRLVGAGEYPVDTPATDAPGHFALAVKDYAHSTAPNRRYSDLVTQRLLKAVLRDGPSPYPVEELTRLARLCTQREDDANRVERQVRKSAAAMLVVSRIPGSASTQSSPERRQRAPTSAPVRRISKDASYTANRGRRWRSCNSPPGFGRRATRVHRLHDLT